MNMKKLTGIIILVGLLLSLGWPVAVMVSDAAPPLLPPRPGFDPDDNGQGNGDDDNGDNGDSDRRFGEIRGTVVDLSTGQPGAGLTVSINGIEITTDASGDFSLTGAAVVPGTYTVQLNLPPGLSPATRGQTVSLTGSERVEVDLGYYSDAPPTPTPAPTPTRAASPTPPLTSADVPCDEIYIVQAGDWLSTISEETMDDVLGYPRIITATNEAAEIDPTTFQPIDDPLAIEPDQALCIPARGR